MIWIPCIIILLYYILRFRDIENRDVNVLQINPPSILLAAVITGGLIIVRYFNSVYIHSVCEGKYYSILGGVSKERFCAEDFFKITRGTNTEIVFLAICFVILIVCFITGILFMFQKNIKILILLEAIIILSSLGLLTISTFDLNTLLTKGINKIPYITSSQEIQNDLVSKAAVCGLSSFLVITCSLFASLLIYFDTFKDNIKSILRRNRN